MTENLPKAPFAMSDPHIAIARPPMELPRSSRHRPRLVLLAGLLCCASCATFPDLDGRMTDAEKEGRFPKLVPAENILSRAGDNLIQPDTQDTLENRIAALESRADNLRDTGLEPETRARMQQGVRPSQP